MSNCSYCRINTSTTNSRPAPNGETHNLCDHCTDSYDRNFKCPGCGSWDELWHEFSERVTVVSEYARISALGGVELDGDLDFQYDGDADWEANRKILHYSCCNCGHEVEPDDIDPSKKIAAAKEELAALLDSI